MTSAERLMLTGVTALCPDCGDERILVEVGDPGAQEYCCTSCDAAVVLVDLVEAPWEISRLAS
jgi:hypothetical protein